MLSSDRLADDGRPTVGAPYEKSELRLILLLPIIVVAGRLRARVCEGR